MATTLRIGARNVPGFRTVNLFVQHGRWTNLDIDDPKVRADVVAYVPTHILLAPGQDRELAAAELAFEANKLVDLRAKKTAEKKTAK